MKRIVYIVAITVGIGILAHTASAYNCYECQDEKGKNLACEINVESVLTPNCTVGFECIKYIWKSSNTSIISRSCAPSSKCAELKATQAIDHVLEFCQACNSPLCNSAFMTHFSFSMLLGTILFAVLQKFT